MKNGYAVGGIAGAIAGLADSIVSHIVLIVGSNIGIWPASPEALTLSFFLSTFPGNATINIVWGVLFGLVFVIVYSSIPGTGVKKGIVYALLFYFLFSNVRSASFVIPWGGEFGWNWGKIFLVFGPFASITYGSVLGYLYKKTE